MKKLILPLLLLLSLPLRAQRDGFAIVIDPTSLREAQSEVTAYAEAIEKVQGMTVYTVVDRWGVPDSLRAELMRLHSLKKHPIAGAVFVGDIPVPMVRDAQFLTSAFKMSQSMPWPDSSVPSDRFYDDFSLQFDFLKRDSVQTHLFYYSLSHRGAQRLHPNLFTGRIRPTDTGGTSRYDKLRAYLRKATHQKYNPEQLTATFIYTGSGSLSESKVAHIDEMRTMLEHFPQLALTPQAFSYLDYSDERFIKRRLMNEMMRPDLGIGIMHHHGDFDTQYLTAVPKPDNSAEAKDYLMHSLRQRLRTARRFGEDIDSVRRLLTQRYDLPEAWLHDELTPASEHLDSLLTDSLNLTLKDFDSYAYHPNCRVAIYDACYNAAFQNDDCIANRYIFQPGRTVAGIGGTVNVLQDKWPDRYIGLLAQGLMVGRLTQLCPELEVHCVGDPTFVFARSGFSVGDDVAYDNLNTLIDQPSDSRWHDLLDADQPDVQCLAMQMLYSHPDGPVKSGKAVKKGKSGKTEKHKFSLSSPTVALLARLYGAESALVRMQAFMLLQQHNGPELTDAIRQACDDNFELLQRFGVNALQRHGNPALCPTLARLAMANNTSARVHFNATEALQFMPAEPMRQAVQHALDSLSANVTWPDEYRQSRMAVAEKYLGRWDENIGKAVSGEVAENRLYRQADFMKIYLPAHFAPAVARLAAKCTDPKLQVTLLSSLGWHRQAYTHTEVMDIIRTMADNPALPEAVRNEAVKTLKRLE